jgi:glucose-1-phosphate adenylyltransferase
VVINSTLEHVLLAEGCTIQDAEIRHSVIGLRSQIRSGVKITDTVTMGADYYETDRTGTLGEKVSMGIGHNCQIESAIIDKNACLGDGVIIKAFPRGMDYEGSNWVVRDGIVVIPKDSVIPPGTVISPETAGD